MIDFRQNPINAITLFHAASQHKHKLALQAASSCPFFVGVTLYAGGLNSCSARTSDYKTADDDAPVVNIDDELTACCGWRAVNFVVTDWRKC